MQYQARLTVHHPYQHETLCHLTCAFFYGIGSYLYQLSGSISLSNEEDITRRFMKELKAHFKCERKVHFYAEQLHITSGYLSTVIKRVSGKSPTQLIEDF